MHVKSFGKSSDGVMGAVKRSAGKEDMDGARDFYFIVVQQ